MRNRFLSWNNNSGGSVLIPFIGPRVFPPSECRGGAAEAHGGDFRQQTLELFTC